jgi:hypothetical protein
MKIYQDLDGCLCDFEDGYFKLTGHSISGINSSSVSKSDFWAPISEAGAEFWANLIWMSDGKQLWEYIIKYNPTILSAPSLDPSSKQGKLQWIEKHIPGTPIIFKYAKNKKDLASPDALLIDDRIENFQQWMGAGGIGILHTSALNTIEQLQKLGF